MAPGDYEKFENSGNLRNFLSKKQKTGVVEIKDRISKLCDSLLVQILYLLYRHGRLSQWIFSLRGGTMFGLMLIASNSLVEII